MQRTTLTSLALALAFALNLGCESKLSNGNGGNGGGLLDLGGQSQAVAGPGLMPQAKPPIDDLPVPIGFVLVESISRDYTLAAGRLVDHTYQGRDAKIDVDRFYQTQMPDAGWTMQDRRTTRGIYTLNFTNATERCEVRITEVGGLTGKRTNVAIHVQPFGPANATPETN